MVGGPDTSQGSIHVVVVDDALTVTGRALQELVRAKADRAARVTRAVDGVE